MVEAPELVTRHCQPCKRGTPPLAGDTIAQLLSNLHSDWALSGDGKSILRTYIFDDYHRTISFVNAIARISEKEGHHPDLTVSYGKLKVLYTTHAIGGLSENDFICAAKIDHL